MRNMIKAMKIITINLPEPYLDAISVLTEQGKYESRSQAIRVALQDFLAAELQLYTNLEEETFRLLTGGRSR